MKIGIVAAILIGAAFAAPQAIAQPMAGPPITTAQALKQAPRLYPALAPLERTFSGASARLKKRPKDAAARRAYVQAAYAYAHATRDAQGKLPPAIQYRAALALYRDALRVDPKHAQSRTEMNEIVDIYKSMGRPVPQ